MSVFAHPDFDRHEQVVFCHDQASGLKAIIAIHDTRLGPALGGCRMFPYASDDEALRDVLRLSRGMTLKSSLAGLKLGGGKAVIIGDPHTGKSQALLHAMGDFVDSLGGRYITAADSGTGDAEMQAFAQRTRHVVGATPRTLLDGSVASGDPSPSTAYGVFVGLKEAVRQRLGRDELTGLKVAIQGVGHVGLGLARHLKAAGAELWVADIFDANVKQAMDELGANVVRPQDIYGLDVDVFAPCAMGGILNEQTLEVLRAPVIAGAANNQLASAGIGVELQRRNQLYAPDYAINAGGIIDVYYQRNGGSAAQIDAHVNAIAGTLREIFERAAASGECTSVIADRLALERLQAGGAPQVATLQRQAS
ncbi:Glu/Leu/Phe/Val dehydrogenase dimerization domain-containing protein [Stutzerimonas kunmingensis]|jgi:leucine dehydrogenase|uniref:Glu/Leu/Phe/Val dehydrogenase dimerization domain-containing protein n=1 Tax=Stutzerimonas kunmingensis TaxID=1211807 RepID=UPI001E2955F6|nr:Glu/Leu/Phe/Val dehydrogenase dimerization domain-containing protein [Stutzerimonas kunmingensis]MCD1639268.1 amino acid dehydrogenase [Stutzerimonas stutzeri]